MLQEWSERHDVSRHEPERCASIDELTARAKEIFDGRDGRRRYRDACRCVTFLKNTWNAVEFENTSLGERINRYERNYLEHRGVDITLAWYVAFVEKNKQDMRIKEARERGKTIRIKSTIIYSVARELERAASELFIHGDSQ